MTTRPGRHWSPREPLRRGLPRTRARPGPFVAAIAAYIMTVLALDHFASFPVQLALGALTWVVLLASLPFFPVERRMQALVVVAAATCGELTGSILWGVYSYRLHNLPMFVPPGHGLVYLTGVSLSQIGILRKHARLLVGAAAAIALVWALAGLTVLPHRDVAGAAGAVLLLAFLWRSRFRTIYAGVFLVVGGLELYGTAIGTWRWAAELPGLGIPDGNPPSGVASGYVWFDVVALALAPRLLRLLAAARSRIGRVAPRPAPARSS